MNNADVMDDVDNVNGTPKLSKLSKSMSFKAKTLPKAKVNELSNSKQEVNGIADILLVKDSFIALKPIGLDFVNTLYKLLFSKFSRLESMFQAHRMEGQQSMMMKALSVIVDNLEAPEKLDEIIVDLGSRHVGFGVIPEYYDHLHDSLLEALETHLEVNEEVKSAWSRAFRNVMGRMIAAGKKKSISRSNSEISSLLTKAEVVSEDEWVVEERSDEPSNWWYMYWDVPSWGFLALGVALHFAFSLFVPSDSYAGALLNQADEVSMFVGLLLYLKDAPQRRRSSHYQAFTVIDNAGEREMSAARIMALEDLNNDGVSLRGYELKKKNLDKIRMPRARLSLVQLQDSKLNKADLRDATLVSANLIKARCTLSNFERARLDFAILEDASFNGARCVAASFKCANMTGADFSGCDLRHANLKGAILKGTIFAGANLEGALIDEDELKNAILYKTTMPSGEKY